jgi:predicted RNA-binding Zn-ribbon protein involved in translation (DUF1610 family)
MGVLVNSMKMPKDCRYGKGNGETISWEGYHPKPTENTSMQVNVTCPKCGKKLWKRLDITLTSQPPQFVYECHNCGWQGVNY